MVAKTKKTTKKKEVLARPPVVVILGHVDHGKTSILDYIRKTKIAEKESGQITQHIGAYQIECPQKDDSNKSITFIDTPGHEAFSAMRSRGAKVADIAVLVVAADEGVKPQTKEAISHIKKLELPFLIALNKIDKPNVSPEKIKQELAENEIFVENYGGDVPVTAVSAKTGQGIDDLLEMILLLAEMSELVFNPSLPAQGIVIESSLDKNKGVIATLLVKEGVLNLKDSVACETTFGPVKNMCDWQNRSRSTSPASTPIQVLGLQEAPAVGETWKVCPSLELAKQRAEQKREVEKQKREHREIIDPTEGQKILNIILKADTKGTLEAIQESLDAINQEKIILRIIDSSTGQITEGDLKLAISAKARVFGFKIKISNQLKTTAQREGVKIKIFDIIYELIQGVRESMGELLDPEIVKHPLGKIEILAVFKEDNQKKIIGGKVIDGIAQRSAKIDVTRNDEYVTSSRISQLQHNKKDVSEVTKGKECGLLVETKEPIKKGDMLEVYQEEKIKQTL